MGLSLSDNISYSYTNSWLWDRFRLLTSFGDLGHRKVEHHTEQNIVELSAPRWRIRETGYTRCILDGTPLLTPPVDSTRTRNADSFDESGVPVYSLTADKIVSTDLTVRTPLRLAEPLNVGGIVNTDGKSDTQLSRFTKLNSASIRTCNSHVSCGLLS